jgi:DNA-binding transcriptional regulator YiaG
MKLTIQTTGTEPRFIGPNGKQIGTVEGLRMLRAETGFTAAELARATNSSRHTVNGWFAGRKPSNWAIELMARLLSAHRTLNQNPK